MQPPKQIVSRVLLGLKIVAPGVAYGVLVGSVIAMLLPSVIVLASLASSTVSSFATTKLGRSLQPWFKAVVAPDHFLLLAVVALLALGYILHKTLWLFLVRCYTWTIYEGSVLWLVCSFVLYTDHRWWVRLVVFLLAVLLTCLIAWGRTPLVSNAEPLINLDRPIEKSSEDKLDRGSLVVCLVNRLLSDAAPVVALVGAYGDGKTSILNLLREELEKQQVVVVRFKSSLPGDDLTLVSSLFNSIGKELHRRFFIRPLSIILKRLARRLSGVVPAAPSGLKDIFAEPSQEEELRELTTRLEMLPVRRVIVLLDDMDRMQGNELRMLLKIIRAADDYPKLSFVCAFNKKALVGALIRHQVSDRVTVNFTATGETIPSGAIIGEISADDIRAGYEYLEKFFPVQIPVPKLDDSQIAKDFDLRFNQFAERNALSMLPEDTAAFDKAFHPFWKSHFLPSLSNLRKINTYFNALNSSFSLVKGEVNLIDFMCIELLRQVEPEVYEQVFKDRALFYYPEWDMARWDEREIALDDSQKKKRSDAAFDQVFRNLRGQEREFTLTLLGQTFPKVNAYHEARGLSSTGTPSEVEADKNKRICHPDHFTTYFSLHVQEGYCSSEELEELIEGANAKQKELEAQTHFMNYLRPLTGLKRYRFFEKMLRLDDTLLPMPAKALAIAIALESHIFAHDDFDLGEFGTATRLELVLANRFKDSAGITQVLADVIVRSTSDALAQKVFYFATEKESNRIFQNWEFVNFDELKMALAQRMKAKYFVGGEESIYAPSRTFREWQAVLWWARAGDRARDDAKHYLEDECQRRPASIGKHILWLGPSLGNENGKKVVDDLFPLRRLAELAESHGPTAYSTEAEKGAVMNLIREFGSSPESSS